MGVHDDNRPVALHREARAAWPEVDVSLERFAESLAEHGTANVANASDLYLVLGCLDRQAGAIAAFERHIMTPIRVSVERACKGGTTAVDDIMQWTREKLLLGEDGSPKLAQYTGRGSLMGWVRVVAVREALQERRRTKRDFVTDDTKLLETDSQPAVGAEIALLRARHAASFRAAVVMALQRLTPEQRSLLRFHTHEGLTIDEIAPMLGIHRATAARRLERARADALEHTRAILQMEHGLSASEARSLCLALADEVDVSVARALSEGAS